MQSHVQVLKFGGTSVGSGERMRRVANIIAHTLNDSAEAFPIVVVSAMSKVTDQLLRIAAHIRNGEQEAYEQELTALKRRHLDAAEKAVHNLNEQDALRQDLEAAFIALEDDVARLRRYAKRSLLQVTSVTWRMVMALIHSLKRREPMHGQSFLP